MLLINQMSESNQVRFLLFHKINRKCTQRLLQIRSFLIQHRHCKKYQRSTLFLVEKIYFTGTKNGKVVELGIKPNKLS